MMLVNRKSIKLNAVATGIISPEEAVHLYDQSLLPGTLTI